MLTTPSLDDCKFRRIKSFDGTEEGCLYVIEDEAIGPIRRIFWLRGMSPTTRRGGHALLFTTQHFVAMAGSATLKLDDGKRSELFSLDKSDMLVTVPPMIFRTVFNFAEDAVIAVLCDFHYDEQEYLERDIWLREIQE